ncbi:MAG: universal stress protein [Candidatus Adiutrix sp.]|jgi:nucleotide-binding universal stress UspA family protein|nr:universal stress protein [Candidatus Adiutrix sp.]
MFKMSAVVCATDLSESSNKALPIAAKLAGRHEAKLIIAHIIDLPAVTPYGETMVDPQELRGRVEQSAKAQVTDILAGGEAVEWELQIAIGYPAKEIIQIVEDNKAEMVVAATHTRSGIERLLLGSVSRKLMHTLNVPFLIVPGDMPLGQVTRNVDSILIACDFSPDSANAVRWAIDFSQAFGARLSMATVIEPSQLSQLLKLDPQKEHGMADKLQNDLHKKLLETIPENERESVNPQTVVLAGQPHEELNKYAILNHVDLIVMGVHGRGLIENLLVGSTTDRLVRLGQFPVMAVRSSAAEYQAQ